MRTFVTTALLLPLVLGACGDGESDSAPDDEPQLTAAEAVEQTCTEVRAGIDEFNRQDYAGTIEHFEKAKVPATVYAKINTEPEADALLDAVQYYANLPAEKYPEAARSSENFARNKTVTLEQCASGEPIDADPPTPV
ncbi:MAG: hypothetical protein JWR55_2601 [Aeromicrobium sp.]|jgi:hypothetical protein|nr:hypothetical protein [Aeromicrobium sp.]